jgi:hypothetical protein
VEDIRRRSGYTTKPSAASVPPRFLNVVDFEKPIGIALVVQDADDDELPGMYEIVDAELIKPLDRPGA